MNILYLHGFQSSSNSNTSNYLKSKLVDDNFYSFDLPHKPKDAIEFIKTKIKELKIDILIGTSLGGVYAYNFEISKICINPAFQFTLTENKYDYFNKRNDNQTFFTIDSDDVKYFNELIESFKYKQLIDKLFNLSYILIGKQDEYISFDKIFNFTNVYDEFIFDDFGHRLTNDIIDNILLTTINKLKNSIITLNNLNLHE